MTRIQVIDDEGAILRALRISLTARKYEVVTAADGASGLTAMARFGPRRADPRPRPAGHGRHGTVALSHPCTRPEHDHLVLRRSDGDCKVVEGDAEPVAVVGVGCDIVVPAAQVLHEGMTGGEDPR